MNHPTPAALRFSAFAAIGFLMLFGVGCASSGSNFNEAHIAEIKEGSTTEPQLIQWFGEPTSRSVSSGGAHGQRMIVPGGAGGAPVMVEQPEAAGGDTGKRTVLSWVYAESRINGKSFIPFAGAFLGGQDSSHKSLTTVLKNGVVESYNSTSGGMGVRGHTESTPTN